MQGSAHQGRHVQGSAHQGRHVQGSAHQGRQEKKTSKSTHYVAEQPSSESEDESYHHLFTIVAVAERVVGVAAAERVVEDPEGRNRRRDHPP